MQALQIQSACLLRWSYGVYRLVCLLVIIVSLYVIGYHYQYRINYCETYRADSVAIRRRTNNCSKYKHLLL